ncbi:ABC transporter substrate-binding protein [Actinomyces ruminis]|uniref:ABC transporter substrate-binding protein n=1 Tax=Actinomyces ruminis TaxID=1937003 RepID=A0ABX4MA85_9ACTO|nr:extracellular solute-binding protein [Actinomyces ruminis]PHP52341.1 ABC transporter substrate-binding protein [Actinomyces ruminis]
MNTTTITRRSALLAGTALCAAAVAGCGAPGTKNGTGASSTSAATTLASPRGAEMKAYFETGFPLATRLTEEFSAQFPDVTWNIREDQFAVITQNALRVLGDDPQDIMRLPSIQNAVKAGVLLDLDPYAKAYGWDTWPASQLEQLRVNDKGTRGSGALYGHGFNYSVTGVFYNKNLAQKIGMTEAPETLAELDELLAESKKAGLTGIAQFNGGATGGLCFPLQNLMGVYGDITPIKQWIYQEPGASIDTDNNREAVAHLKKWIDAGYFADDINSLDYSAMMSRFTNNDSLFMFNGDWESGTLDSTMPDEVGFFLMPTLDAGDKKSAMSSPLTVGVSANAPNPDNAAFFLNWVATNEKARDLCVKVGGSHPMGPDDAYMPAIDEGTVTSQTLSAGTEIAADNGAMDFIANATDAVYAKSWTPNLQDLVAGKQTADALLAAVQKDYESQVAEAAK